MSVRSLFSAFIYVIIFLISAKAQSQINTPKVVMKAADTISSVGEESGLLSIYIDNYDTEIFGFQFVLKSNRPDLVTFDFSGLGFDTSGTLLSGFEYIVAIDRAGDQSEYWFRCIANIFGGGPTNQPGILPQLGGTAIRIPYNTTYSPDTTKSLTSELTFEIPTDFSDPYGNSIGAIPDTIVDTAYYNCLNWENAICTSWVEVIDTSLGYEMVYYDSSIIGLLDSTIVVVIDGSITVNTNLYPEGTLNCDIDRDGVIDITDLANIVACMFQTDNSPTCSNSIICDFDLNGYLDITDLVYLVEFMFNSGSPPPDL